MLILLYFMMFPTKIVWTEQLFAVKERNKIKKIRCIRSNVSVVEMKIDCGCAADENSGIPFIDV